MRCLHFSTVVFIVLGCASDYRHLKPVQVEPSCISRFVPFNVSTLWYHTSVDVVGRHISGLLLIKNMPDSSQRVVFTNEAGVTFFDFGFLPDGSFKVHNVIKQLDKRPVIQTLRKDFQLMLGLPFRNNKIVSAAMNDEIFHGAEQKKETAYFITSKDCASLRRLELGSSRKRKVTVRLAGKSLEVPDTIEIEHHTFNMQIKLIRFEKE